MGSISPTLTKNVHNKKDTGHIAGKPSAHCSDQYIIHQPELQRSKLYLVSFMSCCYGNGPPEIKAVVIDGLCSENISGAVMNIHLNRKAMEKNGKKRKPWGRI